MDIIELPSELATRIGRNLLTAHQGICLCSYKLILQGVYSLSPAPVYMQGFHYTLISNTHKNIPLEIVAWLLEHAPRTHSVIFGLGERRASLQLRSFHYFYVQYSAMLVNMGIYSGTRQHIDLATKHAVSYVERTQEMYWNGTCHIRKKYNPRRLDPFVWEN